jgi:hypothetical protein
MALVPSRYGKKIELLVKVASMLNTIRIFLVFEVTDLGLGNWSSGTPQFLKVAFGRGSAPLLPNTKEVEAPFARS